MSSPLITIRHATRDVQQALANNCWSVFHRAAATEAAPAPAPAPAAYRVSQARTRRGQFQVRYLQTGEWYLVAPADLLFQQ
ncbi:hypothetical protein [Hymenobacter koreensis]|uniref:Uncharacterized protein n=1 Tax=Hymenobacter koreensis TaxID=1084523 RepID=A0ABP8JQA6_9BACT